MECPGSAADGLPSLATWQTSSPSSHSPSRAGSVTHSPLTGPWGCHLWIHLRPRGPAQLSHRILHMQTVNDNSVRAYHIPYSEFPPPTTSVHSMLMLSIVRCNTHFYLFLLQNLGKPCLHMPRGTFFFFFYRGRCESTFIFVPFFAIPNQMRRSSAMNSCKQYNFITCKKLHGAETAYY